MKQARHAVRVEHAKGIRRLLAGTVAGTLVASTVVAAGLSVPASGAIANSVGTTMSSAQGDDYSRTVSRGWGTLTSGQPYKLVGASSLFSVDGNRARINALGPGHSAGAYLATGTVATQVHSVIRIPSTTPSRLGVYYSLEMRRQSNGAAYRATLNVGRNGATALSISRGVHGSEVKLAGNLAGPKVAAGQDVTLMAAVTGTSPALVQVKAFLRGSVEPAWQLTVKDTAASRITNKGDIGILAYVSSSSVPTTLAFDTLRVWSQTTTKAPAVAPAPAEGKIIRRAAFDSEPLGQVVPAKFNAELGGNNPNPLEYDDMTIVPDSRGVGRVLRTTLKKGTIHSIPSGNNGANFFMPLPAGLDRACMQYDIKFDGAFDWSLGGKLPGLEGVAPGIAPSAPTGGHPTSEGWSGRMMWVGPDAYSWAGSTNMAVSYMYHPGQESQYGDNIQWKKPFVAGRWHTVKQCYAMNTVGKANGVLQAWMDGTAVIDRHDFVYRTDAQVHINYIVWALFRGGNTTEWAGSRDGYVDIDNVRVTES